MKRICFALLCCYSFLLAQMPTSNISPTYIQDLIQGKNKSGIILGIGVGIPSTGIQFLSGEKFENTTSYGYHFLIGYQDFSRFLTPFPQNIFGARATLEFIDTYHIDFSSSKSINSSSFLINYDLLFDIFARKKRNTAGFIVGLNTGLTKIETFQSFSFSIGLNLGVSLAFDTDNRLDITYKISASGPLQGDKLHFYSPYTINLTYTHRFSIPTKPQKIEDSNNTFDNAKFLIK